MLDLTRLLPGAVCTLHLADLGADVVKVEDPGPGDYARKLDANPGEVSAFYRMVNRNKRSLMLDLKAAAGCGAFLRLACHADIVVESFRPGVLDKLDYLKVGLALVLVFVGAKMIVEPWLHISVGVSLAIVLGMLMVAVLASLLRKKKSRDQGPERLAGQ